GCDERSRFEKLRMAADVAPTFFSVCAQQVLSPKSDDARNADSARDSGNDLAVHPNDLRPSVDTLARSTDCLFATLVESGVRVRTRCSTKWCTADPGPFQIRST